MFKSCSNIEGFLFLQETHSTLKDEVNWIQEFKGQLFFSYGKSNSYDILICYFGSKKLKIRNKIPDKDGWTLILEIKLNNQLITLINLHNPNTESEQLEGLEKVKIMLSTSSLTQDNQIIFAGDFNLFSNSKPEHDGVNPLYKNRSVTKLIRLKEKAYFNQYLSKSKFLWKKIYFQGKSFSGIYSALLRLHFHI